MSTEKPSLPEFEKSVATRNFDAAIAESVAILTHIDRSMGETGGIEGAPVSGAFQYEAELERFATRFAAAFGQMICDPAVTLSFMQFEQLMYFNRWLNLIFYTSGFGTTAHLVSLLTAPDERGIWTFNGNALLKFFIIYSPDSGLKFDFEQCFQGHPAASAVALLNYLSTRYCFTERTFSFREQLLEWLPGKFGSIKLGAITLCRVAEVYMYCSYAALPNKHAIKSDLISQLRRLCFESGCLEAAPERRDLIGRKPVIVVITDNFNDGHSVYRTHSRSVKALRESFHVVGVLYERNVQPATLACFDEIVVLPTKNYTADVKETADQVLKHKPDIVFHLGVGMSSHTIALASLRLAPIQCVSFGHTATTMSPAIDYMILPEDFVNSRSCYSEELLLLPPAAMPYTLRTDGHEVSARERERRSQALAGSGNQEKRAGVVRVAMVGSIMKLNSQVLDALVAIRANAKVEIELEFFPLAAVGVAFRTLQRRVQERLPGAIVHPQLPHLEYFKRLGGCDIFLCPFPYGNMNSIVDAFQLGLPGVCLDGAEAHAHADAAYFKRMGMPTELIGGSIEDYVNAATRLINDLEWRDHCTEILLSKDPDAVFCEGDERLFSRAIRDLLSEFVPENELV